jgi:hypothetical protein
LPYVKLLINVGLILSLAAFAYLVATIIVPARKFARESSRDESIKQAQRKRSSVTACEPEGGRESTDAGN